MMFKSIALFLLATTQFGSGDDSVTSGTDLVLTLMVNRHGDRTPVETTLSYSDNPDALKLLTEPYGYGQLTNVGKRRAYQLGRYIRERYNELLSPQYNRSEIYIRATDSTRAKMTILTAMAAVYPAGISRWSEDIDWVPVPYTTVPAKYDYNLAVLNCPNYISAYYGLFLSNPSSMAQYSDVLNTWSELLPFNITEYPALAYSVYDVYTAQISLGLALDPVLEALFPEIEAIADEAIDIVFGNEAYIAWEAGVLLNEFFTAADTVISGEDVQRVNVYSAHDLNVYALMAVSQITPRQGVPKYASAFSLELRRIVDTGKYVVLPVYMSSPGEDVMYLQVDGCSDLLCEIEEFRNITSKYTLDLAEWKDQCGWTEDVVVDDSSIA